MPTEKDLKKVVDKVRVTESTGFYGLFSNAEENKSTYVGDATSRKKNSLDPELECENSDRKKYRA
jgi:hypothetical protein